MLTDSEQLGSIQALEGFCPLLHPWNRLMLLQLFSFTFMIYVLCFLFYFLSPLFPVPVCAAVASGFFFPLCVFCSVSTRGRGGAGTDAAVSIVHQMGHLGPRHLSHGLWLFPHQRGTLTSTRCFSVPQQFLSRMLFLFVLNLPGWDASASHLGSSFFPPSGAFSVWSFVLSPNQRLVFLSSACEALLLASKRTRTTQSHFITPLTSHCWMV